MRIPVLHPGYEITRQICEEATTRIFRAIELETGADVAIKYPKPRCVQTEQESQILMCVSHPHIIPLLDILDTPDGPALVFPFAMRGDLFGAIGSDGIPEDDTKAIMCRVLQALAYLHDLRIWHLDVKPENILIMSGDVRDVALADFGLAAGFPEGGFGDQFCGSLAYAAPEVLRRDPYTEKADIWSSGITMFACLAAAFPFDTRDKHDMMDVVLAGIPNLLCLPEMAKISKAGKDLLRQMLTLDPDARISAQEALQHEWFQEYVMWSDTHSNAAAE
jgi:serine/threonine protein kinase